MRYAYQCRHCGHRKDFNFPVGEAPQEINDGPHEGCDDESPILRRVYDMAGVVFKGDGFHHTDYNRDTRMRAKHR